MKIFNKIVVFLLSLSIFPIFYFLNLVRAVVSISESSSLYTILSKLAEDTANSAIELNLDELYKYSNAIEWIDVCKLPE